MKIQYMLQTVSAFNPFTCPVEVDIERFEKGLEVGVAVGPILDQVFGKGFPFAPNFTEVNNWLMMTCSFECSFRWFPVRILCQALATAQRLCLVLRVFRFSPCRSKPFLLPFYWTRQW